MISLDSLRNYNPVKLIKNILVLLFLLAALPVMAQKRQNVYFYKDDGKEVGTKDSADFIRIIQEPDSGSKHFVLIEVYPNGAKKRLGTVSYYYPKVSLEGQVVTYYKSGRMESLVTYKGDQINGAAIYYFPNGRVNKSLEYLGWNPPKRLYGARDERKELNIKLNYLADSLGNEMVVNGNGHAVEPALPKDSIVSEGDFKNGFKQGLWTGKSLSGNGTYQEEYAEGLFIKGSATVDGITKTYKDIDQEPDYPGGREKFYRNLQRKIYYPADAKHDDIQGKVFLSFVIDRDGSVSKLTVDRKLYPSLDKVAMTGIRECGNWIPAAKHGIPVISKINIPVSFTLSNPPEPTARKNNMGGF